MYVTDTGLGYIDPSSPWNDPNAITQWNYSLMPEEYKTPSTMAALAAKGIDIYTNILGSPIEAGHPLIAIPNSNMNSNTGITFVDPNASSHQFTIGSPLIAGANPASNSAVATINPTQTTSYQPAINTSSDWFSKSSLVSGIPNWSVLAGGLGLLFMFKK